jgi:hypothetical protein
MKKFALYLIEKTPKVKEPKPPKIPAPKKMLGGLDQGELNKVFATKSNKDPQINRGNKFVEKYLAGEDFQLADGTSVKLQIEPDVKHRLEAMYKVAQEATANGTAGTAKPYLGFNSIHFTTTDAVDLTIHNFAKTSEFGGEFGGKVTKLGKESAGGTAVTKQMESLQCWYTAAAFLLPHFGLENESSGQEDDAYEQFVAAIPKIASHVQCDVTADQAKERPGPVDKKGRISKWEWSLIATAQALENHAKFKHEKKESFDFYRDATTTLAAGIKSLFATANNNEVETSGTKSFKGSDKWNPADMWIVRKGSLGKVEAFIKANVDKKELTFDILNTQMKQWFDKNDLVGVSLKGGDKKSGLHASVMNDKNVENPEGKQPPRATFDTVVIPKKAADGDIVTQSYSVNLNIDVGRADYVLNMRAFGKNKSSWSAEVIGKGARGGKMGLFLAQEEMFKTAAEFEIPKEKVDLDIKAMQSMTVETLTEEILLASKQLGSLIGPSWTGKLDPEEEEKQQLLDKHDWWLFSKLVGLKIAVILTKYDDMADAFMAKVFKYAFSEHHHSAVYMKVSSFTSHEDEE